MDQYANKKNGGIKMKIIASRTGEGKTSEILRVVDELSKEGINTLYLTNDQSRANVKSLSEHLNLDVSHMQYEYTENVKQVIQRIVVCVDSYDYYFVDMTPSYGEVISKNLRVLSAIEDIFKTNIYTTMQKKIGESEGIKIYEY